ncbi:hypothetical protein [Vibrio tubiashii]|uniref:hypothetical protein n=1 Tax=Vibrio tubiashii TaxID=29498 RepID=UPI00349E92A7
MKNRLIVALVAFYSAASFSDECTSWGCISTVETLYTNANGDIYVGTPLNETLANCTPVSNVYFTLNPSAPNASEIYSSLLAAYMSGKKIQLRVQEGHSRCELSYVRLDTRQ